jgi:hypothetical protein
MTRAAHDHVHDQVHVNAHVYVNVGVDVVVDVIGFCSLGCDFTAPRFGVPW